MNLIRHGSIAKVTTITGMHAMCICETAFRKYNRTYTDVLHPLVMIIHSHENHVRTIVNPLDRVHVVEMMERRRLFLEVLFVQ